MEITTKKWQPEGRPIPGVNIDVKTAAVYNPNTIYTFTDYNITRDVQSVVGIKSDAEGKISFGVDYKTIKSEFPKKTIRPKSFL